MSSGSDLEQLASTGKEETDSRRTSRTRTVTESQSDFAVSSCSDKGLKCNSEQASLVTQQYEDLENKYDLSFDNSQRHRFACMGCHLPDKAISDLRPFRLANYLMKKEVLKTKVSYRPSEVESAMLETVHFINRKHYYLMNWYVQETTSCHGVNCDTHREQSRLSKKNSDTVQPTTTSSSSPTEPHISSGLSSSSFSPEPKIGSAESGFESANSDAANGDLTTDSNLTLQADEPTRPTDLEVSPVSERPASSRGSVDSPMGRSPRLRVAVQLDDSSDSVDGQIRLTENVQNKSPVDSCRICTTREFRLVALSVFDDGIINWKKIAVLITFAVELARHCMQKGQYDQVSKLEIALGNFIAFRLYGWIDKPKGGGGWNGFLRFYRDNQSVISPQQPAGSFQRLDQIIPVLGAITLAGALVYSALRKLSS